MAEAGSGVEEHSEEELEQAREAQALVAVVGALAGLTELPSLTPGADPVPLPALDDSIDALAEARHLPEPLRLELLARLHVAGRRQQRDLGLGKLAAKLTQDENESEGGKLLERLDNWVEGTEPFGRATLRDIVDHPPTDVASLRQELQCTALTVRPGCGAVTQLVQGHQALSIVTDMVTCKEFEDFDTIVNPLRWPECWLQKTFFKSMTGRTAEVPTPTPDGDGWTRVVEETCDFGFTMPGGTSEYLTTHLNFLYFRNPPPEPPGGGAGTPAEVSLTPTVPGSGAAPAGPVVKGSTTGCAGCTYDLVSSVGNQILVDQGYLLVEQLPDPRYRRYRSQKEVCFAAGNLPPAAVCQFWSLAIALIVQGCN